MSAAPPNPLATAEPWNSVAPAYTEELLPLFEFFSRAALDRADLPANPRIADVAAGPGTLALMAAAGGAKVTAIDFSSTMLGLLRKRAAASNLAGSIEVHQGDGQNLPFPSDTFDAAFSMFGLIFFPDRIAGFRELRRIIKPGRRVIVSSWAPFEGAFATVMDTIRAHVPGIPFGQGQAPLGSPDDYQREMKQAGFEKITVDTLAHDVTAPSVEEFWGSVQRTNVGLILLRRKLGEEKWAATAPLILATLKTQLGTGSISVRASAHLGLGIR